MEEELKQLRKERNKKNALERYRRKVGIPLDAPLIQRGGARNIKYSSKEEARIEHNKKNLENYYRRKIENENKKVVN
jgi:hypothetical protein